MTPLTEKQEDVLAFVKSFIEGKGYPPTRKEICAHFGHSSPSGIDQHLRIIEEKGWINLTPNISRGIQLVKKAA